MLNPGPVRRQGVGESVVSILNSIPEKLFIEFKESSMHEKRLNGLIQPYTVKF